jgi:hypothetical protein
LVFEPGPYVIRLVTQVAADTMAFWTDSLVSPLVKSGDGDTQKHRDLLRSPRPILDRIKDNGGTKMLLVVAHQIAVRS